VALLAPAVSVFADSPAAPPAASFARQVDLTPLRTVAIQDVGRVKSLESFARGTVMQITGGRGVGEQDPLFSYLDMLFRPEAYLDRDLFRIKHPDVRHAICQVLRAHTDADKKRLDQFEETGMISSLLLQQPEVIGLLEKLQSDLLRTAKAVDELSGAMSLADPRTLSFLLRIIPPPDGDAMAKWLSVDQLQGPSGMPADSAHAGLGPQPIAGLDPQLQKSLTDSWTGLANSWRAQDAAGASSAAAQLARVLPQIAPKLYPDAKRLQWESWYFRWKNMTWVWGVYLLAIIPLLMSIIYKWGWARAAGLGLFGVAFGLHTLAVMLRWWLAQRWPNSNMFEAVTTSAWMCGVLALVLEVLVRKTALRNFFALGSAVASMAALMAVYKMPVKLNPQISNMMPILHDVWLLIHTNCIIISYGLIAMAAVSALLYLGYRVIGGNPRVAKTGGAGSLILSGSTGGFLIDPQQRTTAGQIMDAATMVLMELSFILLWSGLVMGAIWADHSWGRPWGWDPKEVFALNTFIVFLLLVHVRFKVRDKGLWTAVLAVVGCGVMLFNWIVVNFVITGLHSYA